jgi:hypothetical protein
MDRPSRIAALALHRHHCAERAGDPVVIDLKCLACRPVRSWRGARATLCDGSRLAAFIVSTCAPCIRPEDFALCRSLRASSSQRRLLRHSFEGRARRLGLRSRDRRERGTDRSHPSCDGTRRQGLFEEAARLARSTVRHPHRFAPNPTTRFKSSAF